MSINHIRQPGGISGRPGSFTRNDDGFRKHSPVPLFVNNNAILVCPIAGEGCEWGTYYFPFHNLADAIGRASPMVPIFIQAGEYPVRNAQGQFAIQNPVVLKAIGGKVKIF